MKHGRTAVAVAHVQPPSGRDLKTQTIDLIKYEKLGEYRAYVCSEHFVADTCRLVKDDLPALAKEATRLGAHGVQVGTRPPLFHPCARHSPTRLPGPAPPHPFPPQHSGPTTPTPKRPQAPSAPSYATPPPVLCRTHFLLCHRVEPAPQ